MREGRGGTDGGNQAGQSGRRYTASENVPHLRKRLHGTVCVRQADSVFIHIGFHLLCGLRHLPEGGPRGRCAGLFCGRYVPWYWIDGERLH